MLIAKVTGSLVSTEKVGSMVGHKLLMVEPYRLDAKTRSSLASTGRSMVAVDTVGAGAGELVLITQGSSARLTPETKSLPIDTVIDPKTLGPGAVAVQVSCRPGRPGRPLHSVSIPKGRPSTPRDAIPVFLDVHKTEELEGTIGAKRGSG